MSTFERPQTTKKDDSVENIDEMTSLVDLISYYGDSKEAEVVQNLISLIRNTQKSPNALRELGKAVGKIGEDDSLSQSFKNKVGTLMKGVVSEFNRPDYNADDFSAIDKIIYGDTHSFDPNVMPEETPFSLSAGQTSSYSSNEEGVLNQKKLLENDAFVKAMRDCPSLEAFAELFRDAKQGYTVTTIEKIISVLKNMDNENDPTIKADFEYFVKTKISPLYKKFTRTEGLRYKLNELIRKRVLELGVEENEIDTHLPSLIE